MPLLPFTNDLAVVLGRAGTDDKPGVVVLGFDEGLLLAVSPQPPSTPATVADDCRRLVGLLATESPSLVSAVVVVVQPGFGPEEAAGQWSELRRSFEASDCSLLGWLLVDAAGQAVSVGDRG